MGTTEQMDGRDLMRGYLESAGLPRVRVKWDDEGWPFVPGTLGRVEWQGHEWDGGPDRLYVFTDRARMIARLLEVPGVEKHQMGQSEARMRFLASDTAALEQVCRLIRARTRRPPTPGRSAEAMAQIRPARKATA